LRNLANDHLLDVMSEPVVELSENVSFEGQTTVTKSVIYDDHTEYTAEYPASWCGGVSRVKQYTVPGTVCTSSTVGERTKINSAVLC
jgi:hypothetical protein